jgi:hypothetical protein
MSDGTALKLGVLNLMALGSTTIGKIQQDALIWNIENTPLHRGMQLLYRNTLLIKDHGWLETAPIPSLFRAGIRGYQEYRGLQVAGCDVAVMNQQNIAAFCTFDLARKCMPTILSSDATPRQLDQLSAYEPSTNIWPLGILKDLANKANYRLANACIAWSDWTKASMINDYGVPEEKISVIHPGVILEYWTPGPRTGKDFVDILFVGGDFLRKGGNRLVSEFVKLRLDRFARLHLVTRSNSLEVVPQDARNIFVYNNLGPLNPRLVQLY